MRNGLQGIPEEGMEAADKSWLSQAVNSVGRTIEGAKKRNPNTAAGAVGGAGAGYRKYSAFHLLSLSSPMVAGYDIFLFAY